jgi:hypothetical protein
MTAMFRVRTRLDGWQGGPGLMTHYFHKMVGTTVSDEDNALECVTRVRRALGFLTSVMPTIWTAQVLGEVDMLEETTGQLVGTVPVTPPSLLVGAEGNKFGPAPTGIVVNYLTPLIVNGHRVRGRSFLVPMNDGLDANGTPTAAHLDAARQYGNDLIGASDVTFSVWHRPKPKGTATGAIGGVTGIAVRDAYGVLRSRR